MKSNEAKSDSDEPGSYSRFFDPVAKLESVSSAMLASGSQQGTALWRVWYLGFSRESPPESEPEYPVLLVRARLLFENAKTLVSSHPRTTPDLHMAWVPIFSRMVAWESMSHSWGTFEKKLASERVRFSLANAAYAVIELERRRLPTQEAVDLLSSKVSEVLDLLERSDLSEAAKRFLTRSLKHLLDALEWEEVLGPEVVSDAARRGLADIVLVGGSVDVRSEGSAQHLLSSVFSVLRDVFLAYQVIHDALEAGDTIARLKGLLQG